MKFLKCRRLLYVWILFRHFKFLVNLSQHRLSSLRDRYKHLYFVLNCFLESIYFIQLYLVPCTYHGCLRHFKVFRLTISCALNVLTILYVHYLVFKDMQICWITNLWWKVMWKWKGTSWFIRLGKSPCFRQQFVSSSTFSSLDTKENAPKYLVTLEVLLKKQTRLSTKITLLSILFPGICK